MAWVRVLKVVYTPAVHGRGTTHDPVDFITLREQELRQVGAVLPGDTCDQGYLSHGRGKVYGLALSNRDGLQPNGASPHLTGTRTCPVLLCRNDLKPLRERQRATRTRSQPCSNLCSILPTGWPPSCSVIARRPKMRSRRPRSRPGASFANFEVRLAPYDRGFYPSWPMSAAWRAGSAGGRL